MVQWVVLRPILEICAREMGYRGRDRKQRSWWIQQMTKATLWKTLEDVEQGGKNGTLGGGRSSRISKGLKWLDTEDHWKPFNVQVDG